MRAHFIDRSRSFSCSPSNLTLEPAEPAERHIYANFVFLDFGVFSVHFAALPSTLSALEMKNFRYYCIELWNSNQFITHLLCEFSVVSTYIWIQFLFSLLSLWFMMRMLVTFYMSGFWCGWLEIEQPTRIIKIVEMFQRKNSTITFMNMSKWERVGAPLFSCDLTPNGWATRAFGESSSTSSTWMDADYQSCHKEGEAEISRQFLLDYPAFFRLRFRHVRSQNCG